MLDGWYCRSIANEAAAAEEEERAAEESKLKKQYKFLKGKFKHLLYENECFQQALRSVQKKLLAVSRDRNFLIDRLLLYEKTENTTSESDETESSDEEAQKVDNSKKRKLDQAGPSHSNSPHALNFGKGTPPAKKRRPAPSRQVRPQVVKHIMQVPTNSVSNSSILSEGHMTPEEVERHLQSRQSFMELERAPPTVPTEMFSNEPSLDSESNDVAELETSPSNIGDELSIDMIPE